MKLFGAVLLSLAIAQPAYAQAPNTPRDRKGGGPSPLTQSYAALPAPERIAIETDLIWTGDYNGVADGDFGERAISAVKAFQQRNGGKPTGVLNPQERGQLSASARARQEAVGWRMIEDPVTGARLGIPAKLVRQSTQILGGTRFTSGHGEIQIETFRVKQGDTSLQGVFDQQRKDPVRQTDYSVLKPDFFVLSGVQGGVKKFYVRAAFKSGEVRGVTILYDLATEGTMERVVVAMSSSFTAFPSGSVAGPSAEKLVEYSTGIIIDDAGHILASRQATSRCFAIVIAGLGGADLAAQDETTELALLRLYGARNLSPIPLAGGASAATEVTVAGIADPQVQQGGGAISTAKGRLGATAGSKRTLDPAPAEGFSGGAALDDDGKLVGIVELASPAVAGAGPPALVVPSDAIRGFLHREHVVVPQSGRRPSADFIAGIVRVICTRK